MSDNPFTRAEIISILLRITAVSALTFFGMRILMNTLDPTNKNKKEAKKIAENQLKRLEISKKCKLTEYELMIAAHLIHPEDIAVGWSDIAGLENITNELFDTVILPIKHRNLFISSKLTQPPKGVLLHGPPGCGKTMIAKATAKEAGTKFINLDVSILTDKWYGESQKLATAVFTLAVKLQPCIIFIDEIDSFLRMRTSTDHEATAMMKAQFMTFWDGLITDPNCTVIIMGATNRPQDIDLAIMRRMPAQFHIPLPNVGQREDILKLILQHEPVCEDIDLKELAYQTEGFSGSDLRELLRNSSIYRVRDYVETLNQGNKDAMGGGEESLRSISMRDIMKSLNKMKESRTARNLKIINRIDNNDEWE